MNLAINAKESNEYVLDHSIWIDLEILNSFIPFHSIFLFQTVREENLVVTFFPPSDHNQNLT
jgi:hypothetical protein